MGWIGGGAADGCGTGYRRLYLIHGHSASNGATSPTLYPGTVNQSTVENWITANPSNSLSPLQHDSPVGLGGSSQAADDVSYLPLTSSDMTVATKTSPDTGDIVLGDGFPPVEDTVTNSTQVTTSETTTSGGVDTTTQTAETTCPAGGHDDRNFGSVLQTHINTWQNNGLVASLAVLQSVAFPDTLPTISFNSGIFGNHSIDMEDFSSWFTAVKVLLIASSVILSYRIVFGGG